RGQSKVILYFSNLQEPVELTFNYNLKELPKNNLQACPSFNSADMAQKSLAAFNRQKKAKIKRYYVSIGKEGQGLEQEEIAENTYSNKNETTEEDSEKDQLTYPSIEEMRKAQSGSSNQEAKPKGALHNRNKNENKERKSPEERRSSPSLGQILFGDTEEE